MKFEQQQSKYNDEHEKAIKYKTLMDEKDAQLEGAKQRSFLHEQRLVST